MEILRQPDSLSLLGNLKEFLISSQDNVTFSLSTEIDGVPTTLITESYIPDAAGRISIDVTEICRQYLKTELPGDNVVAQENAARTFTATIGATSVSFRVVNASVRNLALTPTDYLEYNFLTLQPQTKKVSWHSPEYLSYYFVGTADIKAKFYLVSGDTETVTVASITPELEPGENGNGGTIRLVNKVYTVNTTLSRLMALSSHSTDELQGIVDVWVEELGNRKSYIQRYVYAPATGEEHHYLAVNSLGGIDTFTFHGEQKISGEIEHQVAENSDLKISVTQDGQRKYRQTTGYLGAQDAEWLWEFLHSNQQWVVADGTAEAIALQSSSLSQGDITALNSSSFDFVLAREGGLLPESRRDETFPDITVPSPVSDLFFLTPRLIDFEAASEESELVFPVQTPYSNVWKYLTLSALQERLSLSVVPDHTHGNLSVLNELGDVDGHLTYRGSVIGSGNGITLPIAISDVDGLRTVLNSKANSNHTHRWTDISDRPLRLSDLDDNVVRGHYLPLSAGNDNPLTGTLYAQTILPAGNAYDLGSSVSKWNDGYFNGTIYSADLSVAGSLVVTGLSTLAGGADVSTLLAIPTSAPSSPDSGKSYLWIDTTGNYAESISGGGSVANVYDLTLVKGNTQLGKFQPAVAAKTIDIASAFSGYATQDWVSSHFNNYSLPKASANTLGGIKVGNGLTIDNNGVLTPYVVEDSMLVLANDGTLGVNVEQLLLVTQNVVEVYGYTQKTQAIPYIVGPDSDATAGTWHGTYEGITALTEGLTIVYVPHVAGATTTTLNINGLGAKTCYYSGTSKLTTHYPVGTPILFTYYNNGWRRADYNSNTTYSAGTKALFDAGENTSNRVWSASVLASAVAPKEHEHAWADITGAPAFITADALNGYATETYVGNQIAALNLGTASQKNYTTSVAQNGTDLPTSDAVYSAIAAAVTSALHYRGMSSTALTDGGTETATIGGQPLVAQSGDVVIYNGFEFLWENNVWNKLGDDSSYALKTIQISSGTGLTGGGDLTTSRTIGLSTSTQTDIGKGVTAYGWGDHSSQGYLKSSDHKALTLKVGTATVQSDYTSLAAKTYTITKQHITDAIGNTTYAEYNANGYLPLSGGTLSGALTITAGGLAVQGGDLTAENNIWAVGNITAEGKIAAWGALAIPTTAPSAGLIESGEVYLYASSLGSYSEIPGGGGTGDIYALTITIDGGTPIVYNPSVEPKSISVTNHSHSNKSVLDGITSTDITAWNAKYYKPSGGIPKTDLANAVQTTLSNADTAYGWGNHASAGYLTSSSLDGYVNEITQTTGNYVTGITKSGKKLTITRATLPTTIAWTNVTGRPTALSDFTNDIISDWALASNKPTYTLDEVTDGSTRKLANYLPLTGGTISGNLEIAHSTDNKIILKSGDADNYNRIKFVANDDSVQGYLGTMGTTDLKWNNYVIYHTNNLSLSTLGGVPTTRKVNNKALSADITLSLDDVADGSTRKLADYVSKVTSTDNAVARFNGTGGAIQNSGVLIDDSNNLSLPLGSSSTFSANSKLIIGNAWLGTNTAGALSYGIISGSAYNSYFAFEGTGLRPASSASAGDNKLDIGKSTLRFKDAYFGGTINTGDLAATGDGTIGGNLEVGDKTTTDTLDVYDTLTAAYGEITSLYASSKLAIPTSAPSSPDSGKIYLYASSLGEYAVEPWYGFNQLISNGNMESTTGWGTVYSGYTRTVENNVLTLTITSATYRPQVRTALSVANGHWVYYTYTMKYTTSAAYSDVKTAFLYPTPLYIPTGNQKDADYYNWKKTSGIVKVNAAKTYLYIGRTASSSHTFAVGDTVQIKNVMVCDLTEMFGDNIPTVEQFEAMYPQDYYEYTPIGG